MCFLSVDVMPAHSRSKNGVASLAYVRASTPLRIGIKQGVDGRDKPGHDDVPW
jgi:hypothetical protein